MYTFRIVENRCIPLSEADYQRLKNFGVVMVTIVKNNRKPPLGIP
jgi:hypothetical protein